MTKDIEWPKTPEGWHEWWIRLDKEYRTETVSPLHHDNRCELCKGDIS